MRGGVAHAEGALGIAFIAIGPIDLCNAPAVCRVKSTLLVCILQQVAFPMSQVVDDIHVEVAMRRAVACVSSFGLMRLRFKPPLYI